MQEGVGATRASLDFVLDKEGLQLRGLFIFERGPDIRKLMFWSTPHPQTHTGRTVEGASEKYDRHFWRVLYCEVPGT